MKEKIKLGATALVMLLLFGSVFIAGASAEPKGDKKKVDPHNKVQGTMITTYQSKEGFLTIKETFRSSDLKRIYGVAEISREVKFKIKKNLTGIKRKTEHRELHVLRADEKDKLSILSTYPYPQWTYKMYYDLYDNPYYVKSDPINLAWEGTTESYVKSTLESEGWTGACGGNQYVNDQGTWKVQNDQLEDPGSWCLDTDRIHLRLWQLSNGDVVGGGHRENHLLLDVISFEDGENRVDDDFYSASWSVAEDSVWLNNYVSDPYNNGNATVITKQ